MLASLPASYYRFRGLLSMAFFSVGLLSLFTAASSASLYWGEGGAQSSLLPALVGFGSVLLAVWLFRPICPPFAHYAAGAASLGMLTFNATVLASNSILWTHPLSLHSRSSSILLWLIVLAASVYLIALDMRRFSPALASGAPETASTVDATSEQSFLAYSGIVALAMIESRLENVVGFFYLLPKLDQVVSLYALLGSFIGGLLTLVVGGLLLTGVADRLAKLAGFVLALLFLASNAVAYATGIAQHADSDSPASLLSRLSFQSLLYWSVVGYCAFRLVRTPKAKLPLVERAPNEDLLAHR